MWRETSNPKPLPPTDRRMPGRPSYKRKRHVSENQDKYPQVSSKGRTVQCTNCLQRGHNKKGCKNPSLTPDPKPKKKMGRPRLEADLLNWHGTRRGNGRGGGRGRGRMGNGRGCGRGRGRGGMDEGTSAGINDAYEADVAAFEEKMTEEADQSAVGHKEKMGEEEHMYCEDEVEDLDNMNNAEQQEYLKQTVKDWRKANYTSEDIMQALGLTSDEMAALEGLTNVEVEQDFSEDVCGLNDITVEQLDGEEEEAFDVAKEEAVGEEVAESVRKRKPSQRIIMQKLKQPWADKFGRGLSSDKPFDIE